MSPITKEQAKNLRNAFECWQQDYDPVEDKEQHDMFGLGVVAMDALLASLEAEGVECPKCNGTGMTDSGGVYPWGEGIVVPCDCTFPDPELSLLIHDLHIDGNHGLANVIQDLIEGKSKNSKIKNTAPPIPVSVPEPIMRNDADGWWMYKGRRVGGGCAEWYNRALDDCRAAMLQGADGTFIGEGTIQDGNSPVIADGWTGSDEANAALIMLDRIETVDSVDDDRIEGIKRIIRGLAAAPQQEA